MFIIGPTAYLSSLQVWHHFPGEALDLLHPLGPARDHELEGEVVDADLAVHTEGLEQLLGIAAQLAFVLGNGVTRHLDWAAAGQPYLLRVASCFRGQAQDIVVPGPQLSRRDRHEVGEPGIAVLRRTTLGRGTFSSDPDRDARLLDRFGVEGQVLEAIELAVEAGMLFRSQARENLELLVGHATSILE